MQTTTTLYRLAVGADNTTGLLALETIQATAAEHFPDGFTVLSGRGCWLGGHEACAVVEVAADTSPATHGRIVILAQALAVACRQQTVLVQALPLAGLLFIGQPQDATAAA